MPNPAQDLAPCMADFGQPVTLPGGGVVLGIPGTASVQDSLGGEAIVSGRTRKLTFLTAQAVGVTEGAVLSWAGQSWRVNSTQYLAEGYALAAFIGKP